MTKTTDKSSTNGSKSESADRHLRSRPSQARAEKNLEKILAAATELVPQYGISGVSTSLIAKTAGIPVGTVYRYFKNKESIFAALAARFQAEKDRELSTWLPDHEEDLSLEEYISQWVDISQDALRSNPTYRELMNLALRLPDYFELNRGTVARWTESAKKLRLFRELDIPDADRDTFINVWLSAGTCVEEMLLGAESEKEYEALKAQMKVMLISYMQHYSRQPAGAR